MIVHVVTFRWLPGTDPNAVAAVSAALDTLAATVPELISYRHGPDLRIRDGNADYAVVAVVARPADVHAYLDHQDHVRVVAELISPIVQSRQALQFSVEQA